MCVKITREISIGQLDWAKNWRSNRSLYWSIELVTNPIDQSKMGYQFDWKRLLGLTKSPIWVFDHPIRFVGLTRIGSDWLLGLQSHSLSVDIKPLVGQSRQKVHPLRLRDASF